MEILVNYIDDIAFWVGIIVGLFWFSKLVHWLAGIIGAQLLAILKSLQDNQKEVAKVLTKVEANQEVIHKTNELIEKRVTRLEDHVYGNLTKATKK